MPSLSENQVELLKLSQKLNLCGPNDKEVPEFLASVVRQLEFKKQIILTGPPGVGKTFIARQLAKFYIAFEHGVLSEHSTLDVLPDHIKSHMRYVQFHPSFTYEDFMRGIRPVEQSGASDNGSKFAMQDGVSTYGQFVKIIVLAESCIFTPSQLLLEFALVASKRPDSKHFLLIDEMNRGKIAEIFGELYFMLEYRDEPIRLRDGSEHFAQTNKIPTNAVRLPKNLIIIGMMNTADQSISVLDYALRRRFSTFDLDPTKEPFCDTLAHFSSGKRDKHLWAAVQTVLKNANDTLSRDFKLPLGQLLGPSHFMVPDSLTLEKLDDIWKFSVMPYVQDALFDREHVNEIDKIFTQERELLLPASDDDGIAVPDAAAAPRDNSNAPKRVQESCQQPKRVAISTVFLQGIRKIRVRVEIHFRKKQSPKPAKIVATRQIDGADKVPIEVTVESGTIDFGKTVTFDDGTSADLSRCKYAVKLVDSTGSNPSRECFGDAATSAMAEAPDQVAHPPPPGSGGAERSEPSAAVDDLPQPKKLKTGDANAITIE